MNYKFEQFDEPINCESWYLRNINLEYDSTEIILTDTDGKQYSHTFRDFITFDSSTIEDIKTECEVALKTYEV
jgi:hypothetical protein